MSGPAIYLTIEENRAIEKLMFVEVTGNPVLI